MIVKAMKVTALLDCVAESFGRGDVVAPTFLLVEELRTICQAVPREKWLDELVPTCQRHPLHRLLLQDPYTRRAFEKPRGYAGDAEMLDYIFHAVPPEGTTDLGRGVFQVTTQGANGQSVLARRALLAEQIDAICEQVEASVILAVGCGHLREAQQSRSVRTGWRGMLYALDQDKRNLTVIEREQPAQGVHTVYCPVGSLLRGQPRMTELTLIYVSGLFDYLPDHLASRLLRSLFGMLVPGGRLLIANFAPDSYGRGYMEAVMDWNLLYRDEAEMKTLADAVPKSLIAEHSIYRDCYQNIVFLELVRHG